MPSTFASDLASPLKVLFRVGLATETLELGVAGIYVLLNHIVQYDLKSCLSIRLSLLPVVIAAILTDSDAHVLEAETILQFL